MNKPVETIIMQPANDRTLVLQWTLLRQLASQSMDFEVLLMNPESVKVYIEENIKSHFMKFLCHSI